MSGRARAFAPVMRDLNGEVREKSEPACRAHACTCMCVRSTGWSNGTGEGVAMEATYVHACATTYTSCMRRHVGLRVWARTACKQRLALCKACVCKRSACQAWARKRVSYVAHAAMIAPRPQRLGRSNARPDVAAIAFVVEKVGRVSRLVRRAAVRVALGIGLMRTRTYTTVIDPRETTACAHVDA
eukprot:4091552-Pleurochrysis_carterae.AAC.1